MAPSLSIWTAKRSALSRRLLIESVFRRLQLVGSLPVFFDQPPRGVGILLADQYHSSTYARQNVLLRVERSQVRLNACGVKQSAHYHRLRFLFGVKHAYQL